MPFTNAPEPSQDNSLNNTKQRHFLTDFATLSTDVGLGITTVLDILEANERHQRKPDHTDAAALAVSETGCTALQKFALTSARLLGNHAVQEVELIDACKQR
ncbi:hypothetical protein ACVBEF_19785 [Glaciimonas sp. GG7]